jgi:hypothetical protein
MIRLPESHEHRQPLLQSATQKLINQATCVMKIERSKTQTEAPIAPQRRPITAALSALRTTTGALALVLLGFQASAAPFSFSTGNPDGKIATLSRPATVGKLQTETADDLIVTQSVVINQATFIGLVPAGTPVANITGVEVEMYHVFAVDSVFPPSGNVPNRTNSPSDVEIDSATRDSADGGLTFSATIVSSTFTASNSVVNGINKITNQLTHGEGPVTGEEVSITVNFNPPIALPADHYFFRPEVLLSSGDFLWLSAPRPIVAPGTPFVGDLQSWIRNDALAPDWLRIGTDITGQGPFNAAFSLSGETDADGDGVADSLDLCPGTPAGSITDAQGCSIDQLAPCSGPASGGTWKNHGQYVSAVSKAAEAFLLQGLISEDEADAIVALAAQSNCGVSSGPRISRRMATRHPACSSSVQ